MQEILNSLLLHIRESVPSSSHITVPASTGHICSIQVGHSPAAMLAITVHDPALPSFDVSYPSLIIDKGGRETLTENTAEAILAPGVAWIVRKVYHFGFVPPGGYHA